MSDEILHIEDVAFFKERVRILSRSLSMGQITRQLKTTKATVYHYAYEEHCEGRKKRNSNQKTSIFDRMSIHNIDRKCLKCNCDFVAPNKYKRLCSVCGREEEWI